MPNRMRLPRISSFENNNEVVIAAAPGDAVVLVAFPNGSLLPFSQESFDITVSGNGGLEGGAEAASTWYYIYLIAGSAEARVIGSVEAPSVGPRTTSQWVYIGAVYNDSSSNLRYLQQIAADIFVYDVHQAAITVGAYDSSIQSMDISAFIPQTAGAAHLIVQNYNSSGGGDRGIQWTFYHFDQSGIFKVVPTPMSQASPTSYNATGTVQDEFLYPTPGNPKTLKHRRISANPIGTPVTQLWVQGWIDLYLGE